MGWGGWGRGGEGNCAPQNFKGLIIALEPKDGLTLNQSVNSDLFVGRVKKIILVEFSSQWVKIKSHSIL